jgi:hypothetical protein
MNLRNVEGNVCRIISATTHISGPCGPQICSCREIDLRCSSPQQETSVLGLSLSITDTVDIFKLSEFLLNV